MAFNLRGDWPLTQRVSGKNYYKNELKLLKLALGMNTRKHKKKKEKGNQSAAALILASIAWFYYIN